MRRFLCLVFGHRWKAQETVKPWGLLIERWCRRCHAVAPGALARRAS